MNRIEAAAIERLARAIGYPAEVPAGSRSFTFLVDGREIPAREEDGRLVVSYELSDPESAQGCPPDRLAVYAAGRILKEEAALAWDPERGVSVLWQACDASVSGRVLVAFFESFLNSVDWWVERIEEHDDERIRPSEMIIRP